MNQAINFQVVFTDYLLSYERRRFEELLFQHFTNRLSIQFDIIAHSRLNFMYVKTFFSDLKGESESVRLGATRDLLDRAGFRPVDRHEIVKEKSVEELNAQLVSLVGENGAEMLIGAFKSRRGISGPELAG